MLLAFNVDVRPESMDFHPFIPPFLNLVSAWRGASPGAEPP